MIRLLMPAVYILLVPNDTKVDALIISYADVQDVKVIQAHPGSIFL